MLIPERLLQRVQHSVLGHALDRDEVLAFGLDGEHRAALDGLTVDQDRASPALARVTADVCACQVEDVSQVVHEQEPRLDLMLVPVAIDSGRDLVLHTILLSHPWGGGVGTLAVNLTI